jgi:hypothetical protein
VSFLNTNGVALGLSLFTYIKDKSRAETRDATDTRKIPKSRIFSCRFGIDELSFIRFSLEGKDALSRAIAGRMSINA